MAEALRANAEAIRRLDSNQRRIADSIEKGDKATQVVASTKALNETFRGLSQIQRGLLDAVVQQRGRGAGPGGVFALVAVALLGAVLGILAYERLTRDDNVSRLVFESAREEGQAAIRERDELRERLREAESRAAAARDALDRTGERNAETESVRQALEEQVGELRGELEAQESRLKNYLAVKDVADRAGAVEMRNVQLERENRDLRARLQRQERELENVLVALGERRLSERGPDPEAIRASARRQGVIPEEPGSPAADGPEVLTPSARRLLRRQVNHLLQQVSGEEAYELLAFGGIVDGTTLTEVKVGCYRNATLLNSLSCKELEVRVDLEGGVLELRFQDGYIVSTRRPTKRIPIGEDGHSVFVRGVGLKEWLAQASVEVGEDGRLTWKTTPS
jgi:hypothetical protein